MAVRLLYGSISPDELARMIELTNSKLATSKLPQLTTGVKGQVRDAERNLRSYFRVAIIRAVSKARTDAARWCAGRSNKYWLIPVVPPKS
jgi:hypothetical protein